jgi:hypothetical protein
MLAARAGAPRIKKANQKEKRRDFARLREIRGEVKARIGVIRRDLDQ